MFLFKSFKLNTCNSTIKSTIEQKATEKLEDMLADIRNWRRPLIAELIPWYS